MNTHEKRIFAYELDNLRKSFTKAITDAGGDGYAMWDNLDSYTTFELMCELATNNIRFVNENQ